MGYYVSIRDVNATLPAEHLEEAHRLMCNLNLYDDLKRGGSYRDGKFAEKWFSWMPSDYDKTMTDAQEILVALGFDLDIQSDGSLCIDSFDNKTGSEDVFIASIAHLFPEGSYIEWLGEDDERWRWTFGGGKPLSLSEARIHWTEPVEFDVYKSHPELLIK